MRDAKEFLIGSTQEPIEMNEGDFAAIIAEANSTQFVRSKAISRCFCRRCGLYGEVSHGYIWNLIQMAVTLKEPLDISWKNPDELRGYYFVTDTCEVCQQEGERVSKIEAKKI